MNDARTYADPCYECGGSGRNPDPMGLPDLAGVCQFCGGHGVIYDEEFYPDD